MSRTTDEKPDECESCGFKTSVLEGYVSYFPNNTIRWYCDLCASTMASKKKDDHVLQAICYVGNAILAAIKGKSEQ